MSFPLDIIPVMELVAPRHTIAASMVVGDCDTTSANERILQEQLGIDNATLANKLLPNNKPLQEIPVTTPVRNKTWRKVVETLRPRERKKRRAREFDEIMRSSINDPVGDIATTNWAAVLSEVVARDQAHWRKDEIMSSQDALDFTGLQEEIDDDEITALPPLPAQPQKKKEKRMPKEAESMIL